MPTEGFSLDEAHALEPSPTVLVLVDFINPMHFPGAENLVDDALRAAQATVRLKRRLSRHGITTVYANDNYGGWRSEFRELVAYCRELPGARGQMARLLTPGPDDITVLKPRHSAFHSTPMEYLLRQLKAQELIIAGLATDMCVHLTAMDAYMRDFQVIVPSDCTAAEKNASKEAVLRQLADVFRCKVKQSARISIRTLAALQATR